MPKQLSKVVGIFGDRGGGKTLLLTMFLRDAFNKDLPVVANYPIFSFDYKRMEFEEICDLPQAVQDAIVGMDEFQAGADSRDAMKMRNRKLTKLATQLRKRHCNLYYTCQRYKLIDVRVREQTDYFITVEPFDESDEDNHWFRAYFLLEPDGMLVNELHFYGQPFYKQYDTDYIVD